MIQCVAQREVIWIKQSESIIIHINNKKVTRKHLSVTVRYDNEGCDKARSHKRY